MPHPYYEDPYYPPPMTLYGYPGSGPLGGSVYAGATATLVPMPMLAPQPQPPAPAEPESSKLILPDRVAEQLAAERAERRQRRRVRERTRPLTDEECIDRYGATVAELRSAADYWRARLATLRRPLLFGRQQWRDERDEAIRARALAEENLARARAQRIPINDEESA